MEETHNSLKDIAPFLDHELTTMYAVSVYDGYDIDDERIHQELYGALRSKFTHLNVFDNVLDANVLQVIVFFESAMVDIVGYEIPVTHGSFLATTKDIDFSKLVNVKHRHFLFGYGDKIATHFGSGPIEYEVSALIRDTYTLKVFANSKEEALSIANTIDIADWNHPVIPEDSGLTDRRIMRHCRWGNLSVKEI
jgi:hypothetical protein